MNDPHTLGKLYRYSTYELLFSQLIICVIVITCIHLGDFIQEISDLSALGQYEHTVCCSKAVLLTLNGLLVQAWLEGHNETAGECI